MNNATLISKEKTEVKFSFEVSPETLETGLAFAYNKNKNQISLPGFRKGKVPRKLIEAQYGENFFYEDAINHIFPDEYMAAIKELGLDGPVHRVKQHGLLIQQQVGVEGHPTGNRMGALEQGVLAVVSADPNQIFGDMTDTVHIENPSFW